MSYHDSQLNGESVHFGANFVFTERRFSTAFLERTRRFAARRDTRAAEVSIKSFGDGEAYFDYQGVDPATERALRDTLSETF